MAKHFRFFILLFMILLISWNLENVESKILKRDHRQGHAKLATLGVVCKCCDGEGGECRSSWNASYSCPKLQCHPWKNHQ
ncbi:hypothetical protein REPUB_Repub13aG0088000 [Reevesia pubescens]